MAALPHPVDVLVFHHSEKTSHAANAGIDYIFEECDERIITLYDVNYIKAYIQGPMVYTQIATNGETMISPWHPERIKTIFAGMKYEVEL